MENSDNSSSNRNILVTGGAGFIGSHIVDRLLKDGNVVTVFDNLSSGRMEFLEHHIEDPNFTFIKGDLLNTAEIQNACKNKDLVFHVAANPDVRLGVSDTKVHFDQNITATYMYWKPCVSMRSRTLLLHPHPLYMERQRSSQHLRTMDLSYPYPSTVHPSWPVKP